MTDFLGINPTLEDYWRSIILFGRNVASYKFALAKSLLELVPSQRTAIALEDLAEPFSRHLSEHLKIEDKQTTSPSSQFIDVCRRFNRCEVTKDELLGATVRLGFNNVIDAFHNVNGSEIPQRFFTDERKGTTRGIVLTDELFELLEGNQSRNLPQEVEARWRLVETAWQLNISRLLIAVSYDPVSEMLFTESNRRTAVTSCCDALNGYQKGKCFYCFADISIERGAENLAEVDHFLPHMLAPYGIARPIDGLWNLVLACQNCNGGVGGKSNKLSHPRYLARLHARNEFFINSHHPIANTLIAQTGSSEPARQRFLQSNYAAAQELLATGVERTWQAAFEYPAVFGESNP